MYGHSRAMDPGELIEQSRGYPPAVILDTASAGWKGKGIFSTYSGRSAPHIEGGKGQTSKVVHFQLRPNPLAD